METKKILMIVASIVAVLALSVAAIAIENHVRWNPNLEECVYYFTAEEVSHGCYVPEENCVKDGRNEFKNVDASTCYYTPRKQLTLPKSEGCKEFVEGDKIVLKYEGSDPDTNIGPAGKLLYTVGKPFDASNTWQTKFGDAGEYNVKVTVSDGELKDEDTVCFKILPGNHAPVLKVASITVNEGDKVDLKAACTDEDGDAVKIEYSGDKTTGTWTATYDDAGEYTIKVTCTDTNGAKDTKTVTVTVKDVNRKPLLTGAKDVTVTETETVNLKPTCVDPEGAKTTLTYSGAMTSSSWKTGYDDAGEYDVTVTCADADGLKSSETVKVTVLDKNRPPVITAMVTKG